MKIINNQLDIELGEITQEELDIVLSKIENSNVASLDEIPPGVLTTYYSDTAMRYMTWTQ